MILLFDTSTKTCYATLVIDEQRHMYQWEAGRDLADGILKFIRESLAKNLVGWNDLTGIGVFQGPGSFTGLRIGLTVMNTIANDKNIPIVGVTGEDWEERCLARLAAGDNDVVVMPEYGREPNITTPRK